MLVLCLLSLVLSPAECSDPEVEVVIPQLLWAGEVPLPLQGDESDFSNIRRPRSVTRGVGSHPDDMYIHLPALGQNLHLHLQRNLKFLASGFTVEERTELGENIQTRIPVDDLCFYTGEVLNHNGSFASLSACAGLMGYIQIGQDQVMIEPANTSTDLSSSFSGKKHIIRRKRQVEEPGASSNPDVQHGNCQVISGKKKKTSKREGGSDWRERRNAIRLTEEHTLETLVVADSDMVQYHGADATQRFILTVMNMVYNMFQHQSLGIKVNIRVTKLVLLHSRPTKLSIGHHGERSLESFCHWQNEEYGGTKYLGNNHVPGAKEETPVDVAVFMTRTDFCVHKDEPCDTVGQ